MTNKIQLALIQEMTPANKAEALEQSILNIKKAARAGANLIILQELHTTPYFCQKEDPQYFTLAETIPGPSSDKLAQVAKELKVVIVASLFEKRAAGIFHNTAIVLEKDGTLLGKYRKMHIPDDPGYYEKFYFTPGDLGFEPIKTSLGNLGVLVCWDQWFPEAARLMALKGAQILIYPTAIGWDLTDDEKEQQRQLQAWVTIQRSHAIANGVFVASCNRTGVEHGQSQSIQFWGNSFICDPQGDILQQASASEGKILLQQIDLERMDTVRQIWPFFRDRRIDAYKSILKRYDDF